MHRFRRTLVAGAALLLGVVAPGVQADTYHFDPVHTQVLFFANHLGFSHTLGRLPAISGSFDYDPENPGRSRVEAELAVDALYVGDDALRAKLLSDDFFDQRRFPVIRFTSTAVEALDAKRLAIDGTLELHGVSRPIRFEATINRVGRHTFSLKYVAGFSATTTIRRSDFGMTRLLPAVADEVEIRLEVEGIRQ
jgi:polyisoprenoid-binding protein YceI